MQSAARKSREIQSIYPSSHGELLLRIRGKRSEVNNHTDSLAILRISVTTLIVTQGWHVCLTDNKSQLVFIHYSFVI